MYSYGFPATQVFERNGGIVDPMYHNSGDLSDRRGFDFEQLREIAKVTVSILCLPSLRSVLTYSEPDLLFFPLSRVDRTSSRPSSKSADRSSKVASLVVRPRNGRKRRRKREGEYLDNTCGCRAQLNSRSRRSEGRRRGRSTRRKSRRGSFDPRGLRRHRVGGEEETREREEEAAVE